MSDKRIVIAEGNYGMDIRIDVKNSSFEIGDTLTFVIKDNINDIRLVEMSYPIEDLQDNTVSLNILLSEEDSAKIPEGQYIWGIEHTRQGMLEDLPLQDRESFYADFIVKSGV